MTFQQWWDKEDRDSVLFSDYTYGEEVWNAARKDLLREQQGQKIKKSNRVQETPKEGRVWIDEK